MTCLNIEDKWLGGVYDVTHKFTETHVRMSAHQTMTVLVNTIIHHNKERKTFEIKRVRDSFLYLLYVMAALR